MPGVYSFLLVLRARIDRGLPDRFFLFCLSRLGNSDDILKLFRRNEQTGVDFVQQFRLAWLQIE